MKRTLFVCLSLAVAAAAGAFAQDTMAAKPQSLEDRTSYGIGLNLGRQMKAQGVAVNADLVAQGVKDALAGGDTLLTEDEIRSAMMEMQQKLQEEMAATMKAAAEENQKKGAEYLANNAAKEGVVTLDSGLQYRVITEGGGPMPSSTDSVKVHYTGRLIDGTKFDSSVDRGQPAEFAVTGVIKGWIEALQLMKVGSKWELAIPADLAYGDQGRPPTIGPGSVLLFEVELLDIVTGGS